MHHRQAETAPTLTRRIEGREDTPDVLRRNPRSGIANAQTHGMGHGGSRKGALSGAVLDGDLDRSPRSAELNRIEDQVEDHAVKEIGVPR